MIHDIDKSKFVRDNPGPNSHDLVEPDTVMAHGTNSVNYTTAASNLSAAKSALNGQQTIVGTFVVPTSSINYTGPGAGAFSSNTFTLATVAHGLNYIPTLVAYYGQSTTLFHQLPEHIYLASGAAEALWVVTYAASDATNVYLKATVTTFGYAGPIEIDLGTCTIYLVQQTPN